ncbi:hypothetical protein BCR36DRAFT_274710, partial [Piromyces finnis]
FLLVTSTNDKKSSRINVNTKTDGNNTLSSFKSPISVISNENVLNFINELKPNSFINENNEEIPEADLKENAEKTHEPLKTDDITDVPRTLSTFSSLSFISSDIFKSTSFQLSHQGSLDIVNYIINENDFKKAQEKEEKERKEKEEKEREEREKEQQIKEEKEKDLRPQIKTNIEKVSSPIKSAIEGFKTEITGSPLSAVNQSLTINSINARNDLQSNMNGTVFQNNRFNTYLETLNTFNQSELINPYSQPLLVSYKSNIKDQRTQLQHMSDVKRYTFDQIIKNYDEKNKKIQDMTPMKEEDLISWLKDATPEDIYENMHKIIGIPKKMNLMSKKTTEVVSSSSNYPILSIDNYLYQEPKAFTPLYARFKDHNVSLYIKDSDLCCTDRYNSSKLSIFPFPLHIVIGVSSCDNILNIHVVIQNPTKDYCIKTLSFITATDAIALTYSNILYQNVYFDEDSVLRTTFVQIYIDDDNEDLKTFVNRWFRVPFELANCHYEIITDINQISIVSQVFIFMSQKKELYKSVEKLNKWEDSMAIVHQTIYGHPLQVIMAALKGKT